MAKVPDQYLQARAAEILSAAGECFARKGYSRTSMSDIAAESGLSVGGLYRYFESKESLFHALTQHAGEVNRALWAEIVDMDAAAQLRAFAWKYLDMAAEPNCRRSLALDLRLQGEALDSKIVKREADKAYSAQLGIISDRLRAAKAMARLDRTTKSEARALIALLRGAGHQILEDQDFDARAYRDTVAAILDCWIAGTAPASNSVAKSKVSAP